MCSFATTACKQSITTAGASYTVLMAGTAEQPAHTISLTVKYKPAAIHNTMARAQRARANWLRLIQLLGLPMCLEQRVDGRSS